MKIALFLCLVLPCVAQTAAKPAAKPATKPAPGGASLKSLQGVTLYGCLYYGGSDNPRASFNPQYFNTTDADDKPINNDLATYQFETGDQILIRGAHTDMAIVPDRPKNHPTVLVTLDIENKTNAVWASVNVEVPKSQVTSAGVLKAIADQGTWYSRTPVKDHTWPRIGMTESDVHCRIGYPQHTNSDDLSGDQLVYYDGRLYVYISNRTGRVTNVQSSD